MDDRTVEMPRAQYEFTALTAAMPGWRALYVEDEGLMETPIACWAVKRQVATGHTTVVPLVLNEDDMLEQPDADSFVMVLTPTENTQTPYVQSNIEVTREMLAEHLQSGLTHQT
jgi:hypothetical protein